MRCDLHRLVVTLIIAVDVDRTPRGEHLSNVWREFRYIHGDAVLLCIQHDAHDFVASEEVFEFSTDAFALWFFRRVRLDSSSILALRGCLLGSQDHRIFTRLPLTVSPLWNTRYASGRTPPTHWS